MTTFIELFPNLITPQESERLARETGWRQRQSPIEPIEFHTSLVLGQASALHMTLNSQANSLTTPVTPQAIHARFNPQAVCFFKSSFDFALAKCLNQRLDSPVAQSLGEHFRAIRLFDTTCCPCSDALAALFPGCGGVGPKAAFKVFLSYDYLAGQLHPLSVVPANCSDAGLTPLAAVQVAKDELAIWDKAFYQAKTMADMNERGAFS